MITNELHRNDPSSDANVARVDMKLEAVVIPVSDVDRAKEVTNRLPGRINPTQTGFGSANDLASALRRAESAHGEHEKRIGKADPNWPDWYAQYMTAGQAGSELPT
jgi:hypothetical protein